jgi:hypothetical protein
LSHWAVNSSDLQMIHTTQIKKLPLICPFMISGACMVYCSCSAMLCFCIGVCIPLLHTCSMFTAQLYKISTVHNYTQYRKTKFTCIVSIPCAQKWEYDALNNFNFLYILAIIKLQGNVH